MLPGHYRHTLRAQEGTNVFHGAELRLAELIIREDVSDRYEEAEALLDRVLEAGSIFRSEQFRYAVARSRLASRRGAEMRPRPSRWGRCTCSSTTSRSRPITPMSA